MTDWHLVTDTFPPLTEEKWEKAFDAYKQFPEYQKINQYQEGGFNLVIINIFISGNGFTDLLEESSDWFSSFRLFIF